MKSLLEASYDLRAPHLQQLIHNSSLAGTAEFRSVFEETQECSTSLPDQPSTTQQYYVFCLPLAAGDLQLVFTS